MSSIVDKKDMEKALVCPKCRRPLAVSCVCKSNPMSPTDIPACRDVSGEDSNANSRPPRKRSYFNEWQHSEAQLSQKKKRASEEPERFGPTKKKMALDGLLNPANEPNVENVEAVLNAAINSGVPHQAQVTKNLPAGDSVLASLSDSSEKFQKSLAPEAIDLALANLIQDPVPVTPRLPQVDDSHQPIVLPQLPEEQNSQAVNPNLPQLDMDIEDLMCSEDELEGGSDSETTLTAPVDEDDLHSLLEDIMSMDEVLQVLDMYDSDGIDTTTGLIATHPEDYHMSWGVDCWDEAGTVSQHSSWPPAYVEPHF